jgi:preprotein translocase subunit SecD
MKITFRIWVLIACIIAAFILIFVNANGITFLQEGVLVKSVEQNTTIFDEGLRQGDIIQSINGKPIETIEDYTEAMSIFDEGNEKRLEIQTIDKEIINLFSSDIKDQIVVDNIPKTRIKTGLDLQGGARALITAEEGALTSSQVDDLIDLSQERFNVYGLTDLQLRKVEILGDYFMLLEIAGSTPTDLETLIEQQGIFEAKIGNETVFEGGEEDIKYVAMSGQEAIVYDCNQLEEERWQCLFRFSITISPEAADHYAEVTEDIPINNTNPQYLSKTIDFYIDGIITDSLLINKELKGSSETQHALQGPAEGTTQAEAAENAKLEMKKLQTILKTGSLPFKLKIEKLDRISPKLGNGFLKQILYAGLFAILAVSLLILIRYRKFKVSLALVSVSLSEVLIILGVASLISWNLDLPSIAGIVAAIGTGIDSQLIIIDESRIKSESVKMRIKKALFIIATAFTTTLAALIPLTGWLSFMGIAAVSAGLLKGFAITTLIGITTGVLISRPAFADIAKQLEED